MPLSDTHPEMAGWKPVENSTENVQPPIANPETQVTAFLRTTLPLPMQYSGDTVKQYIRPGLSSIRTSPVSPNGMPTVVSAASSVVRTILSSLSTSGGVAPDDDTPIINENVQTGTSYTAQLSDRNTLISMSNNAGGTVTLSGNSTSFAHVQTVQGGAGFAGHAGAVLTNRLGNTMIVTSFSTANEGAFAPTIADTNGNTWTSVTNLNHTYMWYATNIKPGPNTVVVTQPPGDTGIQVVFLIVEEFSGIFPGGLQQTGLGAGSASIGIFVPNTAVYVAARFNAGGTSTQFLHAGPGYTELPFSSFGWNPSPGPPPNFWIVGVSEYLFNPPLGTLNGVAVGPGVGSYDFLMANFLAGNTTSAIMPKGWYTYVENTGFGTFTVQTTANIDGVNQAITLLPNTGVLIVSDGVNSYWTERGISSPPVTFEVNGVHLSSQTLVNLQAGPNITLTDAGAGTVTITNSFAILQPYLPSGFIPGTYTASQDLMAIPFDRNVTFNGNFVSSVATLQTAATNSTTFIVNRIVSGTPTQIGTIVFAGGGTVATFTTTGGIAQVIHTGEVMQILAPASPDLTAADLGFTLSGTR
jgi:hypothetical protein